MMDTDQANPLLAALLAARTGGIATLAADTETPVPVAELRDMVERLAVALDARGVRPGHRVGFRPANTAESVALDFALMRLGAISVLAPAEPSALPPDPELSAQLGLALVVTDTNGKDAPGVVTVASLLDGTITASARTDAPTHEGDLRDGVFSLVFSSGSSGTLKCLRLRAASVAWYVERWGEVYPMSSADRVFVGFPLSIFQQRYLVYVALRYGCTAVLADPHRVRQALRKARASVVLAMPALLEPAEKRFQQTGTRDRILFRLLGATPVARGLPPVARLRWRLGRGDTAFGPKPRLLLVGSAPVRPSTLEHYRRAGSQVYEIYGMTEVGFITWNVPKACRPGTSGRPLYDGSVRLEPDGEVVVRHPLHLCAGYAEPFDGDEVAFDEDGSVRTGDLGALDRDGYLRLIGRKKNVLVTCGGLKLSPEVIEGALETIPGVGRAAVILDRGDALVAILWSTEDALEDELVDGVRRVNAEATGTSRIERVALVPATRIPTTRNLKLIRHSLASEYEQHLISIGATGRSRP
jgi:long-chain acyl-CoA synthetase